MTLLRTIGRRALVAFAVLGVFLLWAIRPSTLREGALITGALLLAAVVIGVLLSWPRNLFLRALLVLVVSALLGLRNELESFEPGRYIVTALASVFPLVFLSLVVAGADWLLVVAFMPQRLGSHPTDSE